jgi:hypothetical protein
MHAGQEQNYWPGYLDALINVMLTLLFMVGIFAIGLVLLSLQAKSKSAQVLMMAEHAAQKLEGLNLEKSQRDELLEKIKSLDLQAIVSDPQALEDLRRRGQTANARSERLNEVFAQALVVASGAGSIPDAAPSDWPKSNGAQPVPASSAAAEETQLRLALEQRRNELARLERQIAQAHSRLHQERAQTVALQAGALAVPGDRVLEFRVAAKGGDASGPNGSAQLREAIAAHTDLRPRLVWEFAPGDFIWPAGRPMPDGMAGASRSEGWRLTGFADAADMRNSRASREVFMRLKAVREQLILQGFARDRIALELRPLGAMASYEDVLMRQIFMSPRP